MTKQEEVQKFIDDHFEGSFYELNDAYGKVEGIELVEDLDETGYDSYGNTDSSLERIYFIEPLNVHIKLTGTEQSYSGEEWNGWEIVEKKIKEVTYWG